MKTILLISPYWREEHRWMVSSVKLAELWQRLGFRVVVACMGSLDVPRSSLLVARLWKSKAQPATSPVCSPDPFKRATNTGERETMEHVSPSLTIYRRRDYFLPDPWNYGIAPGFTGMVRRIIREESPDIIVANKILFWTSLAVLRFRLEGRRVLLLTDALVGMTWWPRGRIPQIAAFLYAWTLGWLIVLCAHRIVFFHPQPLSLLRRLGVARKSLVIPTGIDPAPYAGRRTWGVGPDFAEASPGKPRIWKSAHSRVPSPQHPITVTYVGRLESVKGVDDFLAATVFLLPSSPQLHIQVVGWFTEGHPLVAQYGGQVTFTGLRKDIPSILAATDIFVLPSLSEGLSNALMEAMASGCACIASDVGGNAFLIQNGVSGFLFPAGDREALSAHIRRLLSDPTKRRSLGQAARKRIEEQFSWERVGEQYRRLFEEERTN